MIGDPLKHLARIEFWDKPVHFAVAKSESIGAAGLPPASDPQNKKFLPPHATARSARTAFLATRDLPPATVFYSSFRILSRAR